MMLLRCLERIGGNTNAHVQLAEIRTSLTGGGPKLARSFAAGGETCARGQRGTGDPDSRLRHQYHH